MSQPSEASLVSCFLFWRDLFGKVVSFGLILQPREVVLFPWMSKAASAKDPKIPGPIWSRRPWGKTVAWVGKTWLDLGCLPFCCGKNLTFAAFRCLVWQGRLGFHTFHEVICDADSAVHIVTLGKVKNAVQSRSDEAVVLIAGTHFFVLSFFFFFSLCKYSVCCREEDLKKIHNYTSQIFTITLSILIYSYVNG